MPVLNLQIAPLQDPALPARLAAELTTLTEQVLRKRADLTAVIVEDLPAAQWFIGGRAVTQPTARLEIAVTAGTNTADEKARFVAGAWALLQRQLAPQGRLAEASYVIVRELPAGDWGYGGRSQAARQLERRLASPPCPPPCNAPG
ncbi:MAG: tautomerase family protein [Burkholderiaceae bacterium]|nr:tautomerase family protein [Burkholderiaceae bacterium]